MTIEETVKTVVKSIDDKKGENIKVFYIGDISPLADYFIIATGNNHNQTQAIIDEISANLSKEKIYARQTEGYENGTWILADYTDFIVHIFNPEAREYYNLERLWKDAKEIEV